MHALNGPWAPLHLAHALLHPIQNNHLMQPCTSFNAPLQCTCAPHFMHTLQPPVSTQAPHTHSYPNCQYPLAQASSNLTPSRTLAGLLLWSTHLMQQGSNWAGSTLFAMLLCMKRLFLLRAPLYDHLTPSRTLAGLLLWSTHLMQQGSDWAGGALFATLLCMKHLFLFCAPLYFVYILRHWCAGSGSRWRGCTRFVLMGATVASVMGVAVAPFVYTGQAGQLLSRLFPFGRGLSHAYWAANHWALYCGADRLLAAALPWLARPPTTRAAGTVDPASGVVGIAHLRVLPMVPPWVCALLVMAALLPALAALWRNPHPQRFAGMVAYACLCGFWFGYHVHEKAVLPALLTLAVPAVLDKAAAQDFMVLSSAALYGLLPLLFQPQEYLIKLLLAGCYCWAAWCALEALHKYNNIEAPDVSGTTTSTDWGVPGAAYSSLGTSRDGPDQISQTGGRKLDEIGASDLSLRQRRMGVRQESEGEESKLWGDGGPGLRGDAGTDVGSSIPEKEKLTEEQRRGWGALAQGPLRPVGGGLMPPLAVLYLTGIVALELYCSFVHPALLGAKLPFLPLMLTSMYCALGLGWVWARMLLGILKGCSYL
ncbi:ALG6, ALG8 glycosyltransferase family-domain-containing protein [Dunaliella salina]|uniref:Alpha-1,3-glucosyltransferase n=1 Tax=Dunaliella salina TaxID=3046 RepID=A0ABQ7G308_DUNSA|nr:ALG6, ALG8 glycosyltransferase family-domain-containing protein [Dunaliella salina]|eukprot:KAF5828993.1 ALG6, ALG8 glycosyltransferase family-domain-containing protein [Dunaliella salina]